MNEGSRCSTKYLLCKLLVKDDLTEREGRADARDLQEDVSDLFILEENLIDDVVGQRSDLYLHSLRSFKLFLSFDNFITCWPHLRKNLAHFLRKRVIHCSLIDVKAVLKHVRSESALGLLKQVNVFSKQVEQSVVLDPAEEQLVRDLKVLALLKNISVESNHLINVLFRVVPEEA